MPTSASLSAVRDYLDQTLRIAEVRDYPNSLNGLQLENASGTVFHIGAAVDASPTVLSRAAALGIDLLLVHHGLFWGGLQPMTGGAFRLWHGAITAGLAVYAAHLPLDVHADLGNNVLLCRALGLTAFRPFFDHHGTLVGLRTEAAIPRDDLVARLSAVLGGPVRACPGGPAVARRIGVITGGAGSEARAIAAEGIDTFITGEGPHWTYALAEELGLNILYGGHYATETFGVKALAADLAARFDLPWQFIDHPTGL